MSVGLHACITTCGGTCASLACVLLLYDMHSAAACLHVCLRHAQCNLLVFAKKLLRSLVHADMWVHAVSCVGVHACFFTMYKERWALISFVGVCMPACHCICGYAGWQWRGTHESSVLQCVAVCCSVLQCVAGCPSVLQGVAGC